MDYIETFRIDSGQVVASEYHHRRMMQSVGLPFPELMLPDCFLRGGRSKGRFIYSEAGIRDLSFTPYVIPVIRSLKIVDDSQIEYARKYADRSALERLYAQRGNCDDILIVKDGFLTDSYFCNLLLERNGSLYTSETPLLEGTRRARLIDEGRVKVIPLRVEDLPSFEKVHLINAMIDPGEVVLSVDALVY